MKRISLLACLAAVLLLAGCGGGGGTPPPPNGNWRAVNAPPTPTQKKWTFLVFLNAANDLEEFSILNMNQMEKIGSNSDINIVVQMKRIGNRYDASNGDWSDTRRFYITKDTNAATINSLLLQQNDAVDMGDKDTLKEFVQWGLANFPAQRYCLVMWNHGAGWRTAKSRRVAGRGVSYDDVTGSHINTIDLPDALAMGGGRKWDLLAFDASLMQMAEVAYEVRDKARYIAGSEESPPGEGYPYDAFLARLAQNPDMDGRQLATHIVQDTLTYYGVNSDITHSVLDASQIGGIATAVNTLGGALLDAKNQYGSGIASARDLAENYAYPQNRDLLDFTRLLVSVPTGSTTPRVPDAGVQAAVNQVQAALNQALVINVNGTRHPNSNGLSIFLPTPSQYRFIDQEQADGFGQRYTALAFARDAPNWQSFLVQGPP